MRITFRVEELGLQAERLRPDSTLTVDVRNGDGMMRFVGCPVLDFDPERGEATVCLARALYCERIFDA